MLSPQLYNVSMDREVQRGYKGRNGVQLTATMIQIPLSADDTVMCSEKKEDKQATCTAEMKAVVENDGGLVCIGKSRSDNGEQDGGRMECGGRTLKQNSSSALD